MSISGQIVSEIVAQLSLENSIQTLVNFFWVDAKIIQASRQWGAEGSTKRDEKQRGNQRSFLLHTAPHELNACGTRLRIGCHFPKLIHCLKILVQTRETRNCYSKHVKKQVGKFKFTQFSPKAILGQGIWEVQSSVGQKNSAEVAVVQAKGPRGTFPPKISYSTPPGLSLTEIDICTICVVVLFRVVSHQLMVLNSG